MSTPFQPQGSLSRMNLYFWVMFLLVVGFGVYLVRDALSQVSRGIPQDEELSEVAREESSCANITNEPDPPSQPAPRSARPAPPWFLPAGIIAVILGILAFFVGGAVGGGGTAFGSVTAGLLNPFFFIGIPLGVYWLYRYAQRGNAGSIGSDTADNPKLTHCPDCGKHVSRLATTCPHCGRPLGIEREET